MDEAQVGDTSMQQLLIDLMTPYQGSESRVEYFGIMLVINVAKGENAAVEWAKSRNFKIVTLAKRIPELLELRKEEFERWREV